MTVEDRRAARHIDAAGLSLAETKTVLGAACHAPSVFNTQPWGFEVHGATIDVHADADRGLFSSVDPSGRQLVISCGAALFNLRVAAAHLGRAVEVQLQPDDTDPLLLASVTLGQRGCADARDAGLFPAITRRHTHRRPFAPREVSGAVLYELIEAARKEGCGITALDQSQRTWLFDAVVVADALLAERAGYRADLLRWAAGSTARKDGIPIRAFGSLSSTGLPPMRDFGLAHAWTPQQEHYRRDPWVAVLATRTDDVAAWLRAGQGLQRLLLTACQRGLAASFLNQPLDDPRVRRTLTSAAFGGYPQMILRLGYSAGDVATPRRPVEEVLFDHTTL